MFTLEMFLATQVRTLTAQTVTQQLSNATASTSHNGTLQATCDAQYVETRFQSKAKSTNITCAFHTQYFSNILRQAIHAMVKARQIKSLLR